MRRWTCGRHSRARRSREGKPGFHEGPRSRNNTHNLTYHIGTSYRHSVGSIGLAMHHVSSREWHVGAMDPGRSGCGRRVRGVCMHRFGRSGTLLSRYGVVVAHAVVARTGLAARINLLLLESCLFRPAKSPSTIENNRRRWRTAGPCGLRLHVEGGPYLASSVAQGLAETWDVVSAVCSQRVSYSSWAAGRYL